MTNNNSIIIGEYNTISVIIVNYKCWKDLENCLFSLINIDKSDFNYEVIVVDNKSNDGIFNNFLNKFPEVKFVENSGNNGFSNGCNKGVSLAKGDYFLFLNPDTIVSKEPIISMLKLAKEHSDYGIVSCNQLNKKGGSEKIIRLFPSLQNLFGITRAIFKSIHKKELSKRFDISNGIVFPDWVSGSVVFISRKWFKKVDGWNEDYWMYSEDIDLCKKVSKLGGKIALNKNAHIIHNHGGASRLNVKTAALTKTEVIISKHVYVNNHFKGFLKYFSQFLIVFQVLSTKFILALFGIVLFFIPKMNLQLIIFINLINYYVYALVRNSWLSDRSMNNKIGQIKNS